jgi:hypothetical protein
MRQSIVQLYSRGLQIIREPLRLRQLVDQRWLELGAAAHKLGITQQASRALEEEVVQEMRRRLDGSPPPDDNTVEDV